MMRNFIGIHPVDDDLLGKIDLVASCLPATVYPLVRRANGVDYVVGEPVSGVELLTGHFLTSPDGDYGYPIICKLTDIWVD